VNETRGRNPDTALFYCEEVSKLYQGEAVIEKISIGVPGGGIVSLLGPSGVGKTTLFNVLAGVDSPDGGRIVLAGEDITGVSGKVSYMMQKDLLLEYRTVLDNVILPLLIRGVKKKEARGLGASFFPRFGLEGHEKKYPRQLSGGMRQRAALLRTCLMNHKLWNPEAGEAPASPILLDEPFSALDALTRRSMQNWFLEIAESMKLSALFITHDPEEALTLSDRVYIMNGKPGRIRASFIVQAPRPRKREFGLSGEFVSLKKQILNAIEPD
jgi:ABC-type nitrate/sulfonate/bicarbonate transport system ATPase subunit